MPWTEMTRPDYDRRFLRYASDCTDIEWNLIAAFLARGSKVGRPRKHSMRHIWNAISYIAATGCQWATLPKDFPPFTTVQYYFYQMRDCGLLDVINEALVSASRLVSGHAAEPSAAIIDSQSVKTCESGGISGFDAGKNVKGRKRHNMTDTQGNLLYGVVHYADIQDRDGAVEVINATCQAWSTVRHLFADGGYAGWRLQLTLLQTMDEPRQLKSSGDPITLLALSSLQGAGWSNALLRGLDAVVGLKKTGRRKRHPQMHGSQSLQSGDNQDSSQNK